MRLIARLMTFLVVMVFAIACSQPALAQSKVIKKEITQEVIEQPALNSNAKISFNHKAFDYGIVPRGEYVTHHFPVKNTGTDTLIITKIKPGCGCTTTRKSSIVIPPGDSSFIDISYRSSKSLKQRGKATKRIRVESTDAANPKVELSISATTDTTGCKIVSTPEAVDFDQVLIGKDAKMKIDLTNVTTEECNLVVIGEPTEDYINKYKIKKMTLKPGKSTEIELKTRDDIPPGDFKTGLTLQVGDDLSSRITIPITGKIVEKISEVSSTESNKRTPIASKSLNNASTANKTNEVKAQKEVIAGSKTDSDNVKTVDQSDLK